MAISTWFDDVALLEALTRAMFESGGFMGAAVDAKWPAFRSAFHNFEPIQVACMDEDDIERLQADPRLIRNRRKIRATVNNARRFCQIAAMHGSFSRWWQTAANLTTVELREQMLRDGLDLVGLALAARVRETFDSMTGVR